MRSPQAVLLSLGFVAVGVLGVLLLAAFMTPERPITQRVVDFGAANAFAPGTVATYRLFDESHGPERLAHDSHFLRSCTPHYDGVVVHLVHLEDGSFRALDGHGAHMRELVSWWPDRSYEGIQGWFFEPCHNDVYALDGSRVYGPAAGDLDFYGVQVRDGRVLVDLGDLQKGDRPPPVRPPRDTGTPWPTALATEPAQ